MDAFWDLLCVFAPTRHVGAHVPGGSTPEAVPSVLFFLGTVSEEQARDPNRPGLHSPFYAPLPEQSIATGIKMMTNSLLHLFEQ